MTVVAIDYDTSILSIGTRPQDNTSCPFKLKFKL